MFPGFELFGRYITSYQLMAILGGFAAGFFACLQYKKKTSDFLPMLITLLFSVIGVLVGGTILYGITNIAEWHTIFEVQNLNEFIVAVATVFGGSVFYGGLLGGMAVAAIVIKRNKYPSELVTDCAAPAVALFHAFGRIGCFLGGCCYGIESDFGFIYENALVTSANGVRRFPVQLFESGFELILFGVLWFMLHKGILKGKLIYIYLLVYPVGRFILEFFRGDEYRGFLFGLSTSQNISILLIVVVTTTLIVKHFKKQKTVETSESCSE